jgi:glutathione S-transferase
MNPTSTVADTVVQEITIRAPAARVFEAFTSPFERVKWWNAEGRFHTTHMDSDLRPGGRWVMRGTRPNGQPFTVQGEYRAVERPTLLAFTWLPDWQDDAVESLVRVEFTEIDGETHVRLTHSGLASESSRASHRGWPQILSCLRAFVEGQ